MNTNHNALRERAGRATPGPWELQTSNSWRRIGTAEGRFADGDVLAPTTHRGDNHPDLAARQEDLEFIVAADPTTVLALLDEISRLEADLAGYKMGAKAEADAGDEARAEARQLRTLLIEREAVRIGQGLQRHDDQKQMDELVALGIQQDKDEIANLKAEKEVFEEGCRKLAYQLSAGGYNAAELTAEQLIAKVQGGLDLFCESTSGWVQKVEAERERWRQNYEHLLEQHMPRTDAGCEPGWSRVVKAQELQAQVDQLKLESESLRGLLRQVVNELPHRNSGTDGSAPGHAHRTPGVWDGDNGPLSGQPCAWCAIWAAAKAEAERHG